MLSSSDVKSSRTSWPRGQNFVLGLGLGLEDLSSASASASSICPRGLSSNFLFWPRENECNDGIGNHSEFAMIIYTKVVYLTCVIDINLFKFTFTVVFNYLGVDEVYIETVRHWSS